MKRTLSSSAVIALTSLTIAAGPAVDEWNVDLPHSGVDFSVRPFLTPVQGSFEAEAYPSITFVSEEVEQVSETELLVRGAGLGPFRTPGRGGSPTGTGRQEVILRGVSFT